MPDQTLPVAASVAPKPISCGQIAARLKRNPVSVYRALKRFRYQPVLTLNGYKFYSISVVAELRIKMRRKNGNHNGKLSK